MSILFQETVINGMKLKNRFVRSATWEVRATEDGRCTDELVDFTTNLAEGGIGLIVMGHAYILPNGKGGPFQTGIYTDDFVDDLMKIPERVHRYGSKVALQISHAGGHTKPEWAMGRMIAPSPFESFHGGISEEMTGNDIQEIIDAFANAGKRAKDAGFDAVQFHCSHAYLLNQFLSPVWNKRRDSYGGPIENRARILFESLKLLREKVGGNFPILIKLTSDDFVEGGFTLEEAVWVARKLCDMGMDGIEVSGGSRYSTSGLIPHIRTKIKDRKEEAYFAANALRIKKEVNVPITLVGGIRSFDVAEETVQTGGADYIAMCRPFIFEPHLVNRWKSGDRTKSKCLSDNLCFGPAYKGVGMWCHIRDRRRKN
jgi:2,4-dienoyl-CoA reductase-like NADH-dependent reductase (Old Yellow Enzyme family)